MWIKRSLLCSTCMVILAACASPPAVKPTPIFTPQLANTSTSVLATPTATSHFIDLRSGGFSLAVRQELEFETDDYSINLSDKRGELIISLNGRPYVASSYTIESFLSLYLDEMASRGGSFDLGEAHEITIDGTNGIAIDLSGTFLDTPIAGKAIAVSPGKDFIVFGLGMSFLSAREDEWDESGSIIFEQLLESIDFRDEIER